MIHALINPLQLLIVKRSGDKTTFICLWSYPFKTAVKSEIPLITMQHSRRCEGGFSRDYLCWPWLPPPSPSRLTDTRTAGRSSGSGDQETAWWAAGDGLFTASPCVMARLFHMPSCISSDCVCGKEMSRGFRTSALVKKKKQLTTSCVRRSVHACVHAGKQWQAEKKKGLNIGTFSFNQQVYGRKIKILSKTL